MSGRAAVASSHYRRSSTFAAGPQRRRRHGLPCAAPQIKEMATFDLYLHLPRHIVAPAVRERPFEVVRTI